MPLIWAGSTLEHPGRNLQPAIRGQSAQRAAEDFAIRLPDRLMDGHTQRRPRMPRVQKLPENDPVGVLEPYSTTSSEPTRGDGVSARPPCRPFSTAPAWRAKSRTRKRPHSGGQQQLRSGGHPPRQIDSPSDQIETSTGISRSDLNATCRTRSRLSGSLSPAPSAASSPAAPAASAPSVA